MRLIVFNKNSIPIEFLCSFYIKNAIEIDGYVILTGETVFILSQIFNFYSTYVMLGLIKVCMQRR